MRESRTKLWLLVVSIVFWLMTTTLAQSAEPNRVLILVSYHPTVPWTELIVDTIERELMRSGLTLRVHTEYMDTKHFSDKTHYANLYALLKNKALQQKYDVVIAVDNNALLFLLDHRNELYPDVAIVFCAVDRYHDSMYEIRPVTTTIDTILAGQELVTGVLEEFDHEATVEVALRLHPSARHVILVNDGVNEVTYYPNLSEEDVTKLAEKFAGRAEFENLLLTESNLEHLIEKIRQHRGDCIVLLTNSFLDRKAHLSLLDGKLPTFWQRCDAPVYVVSRSLLELGHPVGGYINSDKAQGRNAADMALRILKGESASNIPIVHKSPNDYIFKYPEMKKFGIDFADLPRGSTVLNQPESFYYRYKGRIWSVVAVITGLALMVVILLINILRRKAAEENLRIKNIAMESSINAIAFADMKGRLTDVNNSFLRIWGYSSRRQVLGKPVVIFWVDERKAVQVSETVKSQGSWIGELTAKRKDGSTFDAEVSATLVKDEAGNPVCTMASFIDITEQKKIKDALQESEERFKDLTEGLKELVYRADPDTLEPTYVNKAVKDLYGYTPEEWLADPDLWEKTIHPDDRKRVADRFMKAKKETEKGVVEYRIIRKDKEVRWVEDHFAWEKDSQGRIHALYGTMYDVTERRRTEEALQESELRFRSLVETSSDWVWEVDQNGMYTYVSPKVRDLLGYEPEEIIGKTPFDLMPPDEARRVAKLFNDIVKFRKPFNGLENTNLHKDGQLVVLETSGVPILGEDKKLLGYRGIDRDITERRKAEQNLIQSEEKYRSVVENIGIGVAIISPKMEILALNKQMRKWFPNIEDSKRPICYKSFNKPPRQHVCSYCPTSKSLRDGQVHEAVTETPSGDEVLNYRIVSSPIKDNDGNVIAAIEMVEDVTEHERAERALRESEEKYRLVIENARDITYSITPEGTLMFIGPQVASLGYSVDEVVGHNMREFIHPDDVGPVLRELARTLVSGQVRAVEFRLRSKDGGYVFVEETGSVVREGNKIILITGSIRDITERKQAEKALRESEQRYKALFEGAAEGILVADIETKRFLYASPAICRMLGYTAEELTQMNVENLHPADSLEHVLSEFQAQVKGEKTLAPGIPCCKKDGTIMYADVNTAKISIDGRECNVGFFTNITERRKAEQALQKAHDELEIRVKQRTADLARANQQLLSLAQELALAEERLRREIATNVHDHIGQNLAISKMKLESLRESVSSPKVTAMLDEIRELIGQTIESSRSLTFELSPPVLYELGFEAAVEWLVRNTRQKHGLSTDFQSDGRPKPLSFNVRVLLFQAVRELLVNIAKHANARNVTVCTRRVDDQVHVTVEDDGVGFDTSRLGSHTNQTEGFGLFSIRERLGYIGGSLQVDSRPGLGTRVTLATPIGQESENDKEKNK